MNKNALRDSQSQNSQLYFSKEDTIEDLNSKLSKINTEKEYSEQDLLLLVDSLVKLGVNTYQFSYCANEISPNLPQNALDVLEKNLNNVRLQKPSDLSPEERQKYFCELYILTYRHFRDEQIDEMKGLLDNYGFYFTNSAYEKETALIYQVKGRYYRSKGDIDSAISNDKKAIDLLQKQNIVNVQVQITYTGTLLRALQNTGDVSYVVKVKEATKMVEDAITEYPMVSRYYYLLAKLYMYILLYDNEISADKYNDIIQKSRQLIDKAIDKENPSYNAYVKNVAKYNGIRQVAEFILLQKKFINQTTNELKEKMVSSETMITDTLRRTQNRYLEFLGLFVSIIAIIMAFVQSFSGSYSVVEMVIIIIAMNSGLLAVYATFLILLREVKKKYAWTIIICITVIISTLFCGKILLNNNNSAPYNQTASEKQQLNNSTIQNVDSSSQEVSSGESITTPSLQ